ncbi:ATP10 protein [Venturia nashicola]|nr:ATP10 protein [Venturia nashicola]
MKPSQLSLLRSLVHGPQQTVCNSCATRQFRTLQPLRQTPKPPTSKPIQNLPDTVLSPPNTKPSPRNPSSIPLSGFKPSELQPLGRPIGQRIPPHPSDNDAQDHRSWGEKRSDFGNWDRHLRRREELKKAVAQPYFKNWKGLDNAKGKSWIANERVWKKEASLWFPNLRGQTLDKGQDAVGGGFSNTTKVLTGKITVVGVFSRLWARNQCHSFFGAREHQNPEVRRLVEQYAGKAQIVEIDVEDKPVMRWFGYLFGWNLRKTMKKEEWGNYFKLKELPGSIAETIGVVNLSAGTVFLVDRECRIRWAGSGDATPEEKASLVKGLKKLLGDK